MESLLSIIYNLSIATTHTHTLTFFRFLAVLVQYFLSSYEPSPTKGSKRERKEKGERWGERERRERQRSEKERKEGKEGEGGKERDYQYL